ncbi:MAG: hypothetical protein FD180_4009 [Planctomycetota bacterium]|nr:MAG: hypothetical protein FD180_4009 [Planctomycetota bacterium]
MRESVTPGKIRKFMTRVSDAARGPARIYLTGGGTAVLTGWRKSTDDIDIKVVPDRDEIFRALPALKDDLSLNVELASPDQFIPALPGWETRSLFIERVGTVDWYHYDPYSQALAKIERNHERDQLDVAEMFKRGMVEPMTLRELFNRIKPELHRYPALNPAAFERRLTTVLESIAH